MKPYIRNIISYHLFILVLLTSASFAQEIPIQLQQQLEYLADANEEETEDDNYWQQLERYHRHPLNINEADEEELKGLVLLNGWQIENLLRYRQLLGKLISVYELQAVPGWEPGLIRKLIPFITVAGIEQAAETILRRFHSGSHTVLIRYAQVIEKQKGFDVTDGGTSYSGGPQKIFARYRYTYKNLLQFGWLGDKDAGEQFFKGKQRMGFDFNSVHLFARKIGPIESLALGDFTVNIGQGLIHWQSLAFKKSGDAIAVKRQSPVLKPYNSAGEYNFHRGVGITIRRRAIEWTVFFSRRHLSANRQEGASWAYVSSIITSGYHRTTAELADRQVLKQVSTGGSIRYRKPGLLIGVNAMQYSFSLPLRKRDEPYNLFAIKGKSWANASIDYSYTLRNIHFFGEVAIDKKMRRAMINGCMISADPKVDLSFVYRNITPQYQAMNANAFTENTTPSNERGLYVGFSLRPVYGWKLDLFADFYKFPWLKYLVDAPGHGRDLLLQLIHTPSKQVEIQARLSHSSRLEEAPRTGVTDYLEPVHKTGAQVLLNYAVSKNFNFRSRMQLLWLRRHSAETGFSLSVDGMYKSFSKPFSISLRAQFFETSGYESRLYGFENDVLYSHSIPAVFGTGFRYYLVAQLRPDKKISIGMRWAQTVYSGQNEIGTGPDLIAGNKRTEVKLQVIYSIN